MVSWILAALHLAAFGAREAGLLRRPASVVFSSNIEPILDLVQDIRRQVAETEHKCLHCAKVIGRDLEVCSR